MRAIEMAGWWGEFASGRQARPRRNVKPYTKEECLESMRRELANRMKQFGPGHWLTRRQTEAIAQVEALPDDA